MEQTNKETFGERIADICVKALGSWTLVIALTVFFALWMGCNVVMKNPFDVYPFILLNLMLSFLAAYGNPVIIMSSRRLERLDRKIAEENYELSVVSDVMLKSIIDELHKMNEQQHSLIELLTQGEPKPK